MKLLQQETSMKRTVFLVALLFTLRIVGMEEEPLQLPLTFQSASDQFGKFKTSLMSGLDNILKSKDQLTEDELEVLQNTREIIPVLPKPILSTAALSPEIKLLYELQELCSSIAPLSNCLMELNRKNTVDENTLKTAATPVAQLSKLYYTFKDHSSQKAQEQEPPILHPSDCTVS